MKKISALPTHLSLVVPHWPRAAMFARFQARSIISHSYEKATTPRCLPRYCIFKKVKMHVKMFKYRSQ